MKKSLVIIAAVCGMAALSASAEAKTARCDIYWYGGKYAGSCDFKSTIGGSFDLTLPSDSYEKYELPPFISVQIFAPGEGKVGWDTPTGKWQVPVEPVRRDLQKPACWVGDEIRICAY